MTGRRQTSWLLTNIATAVNSNYCQPVNIQGREKKSYREGIFIKDFPRMDPIISEDIQKISAIISSRAFSSNIGDFVQSTSTHMNSSFLSTQPPRKENGTLLANVSTINQYIQLFRKKCQLPRYQMSHKLFGLIIEYGSKAHHLQWWPTSVFCFKKQIFNYTGGFGTEKTFNFSGKACFCRLERWNQFGLDNRRRLELNSHSTGRYWCQKEKAIS